MLRLSAKAIYETIMAAKTGTVAVVEVSVARPIDVIPMVFARFEGAIVERVMDVLATTAMEVATITFVATAAADMVDMLVGAMP